MTRAVLNTFLTKVFTQTRKREQKIYVKALLCLSWKNLINCMLPRDICWWIGLSYSYRNYKKTRNRKKNNDSKIIVRIKYCERIHSFRVMLWFVILSTTKIYVLCDHASIIWYISFFRFCLIEVFQLAVVLVFAISNVNASSYHDLLQSVVVTKFKQSSKAYKIGVIVVKHFLNLEFDFNLSQ